MAVFNLRHCLKLYKITYFGAVLQLKLVEEGPSLSQVRFNLHRPQEPLSGFSDFALTPEQPKQVPRFKISANSSMPITTEC